MLAFGPDGYLYAGIGDGGSSGDPGNHGQSRNTLLGKILRIDINLEVGGKKYAIPPGNPYAGATPGLDEIWSFGLRNPWRFSFDSRLGDLWIGDVGQNRYEEINRSKAVNGVDAGKGLNYGWRVLEGNACYNPSSGCSTSGKTPPMAVYSHSLGCSVTGGYVYRGARLPGPGRRLPLRRLLLRSRLGPQGPWAGNPITRPDGRYEPLDQLVRRGPGRDDLRDRPELRGHLGGRRVVPLTR